MILFQNNQLTARKLMLNDNLLLSKWLSNPAVLEFYDGRDNPSDLERVNRKFFNRNDGVNGCIIEYEKKSIGFIQYYRIDKEERLLYGYEHSNDLIYGIDQFIGDTRYWGKGIGTLLVSSMVNFLIADKQADRVVLDPQASNIRALRCYEKCGFKKVKLLEKHELHEGEHRDCWVMEYSR